ncbi:hypothetical protein, partial [Halomonas sp. 707B3]|uniref:hypothetical protein n=1 Tax=Halomonas sp. 707B3 TaxID=1681043 RepID=UPI00209D4EC7
MIEANLMAAGAKKIESKTVGFDFDGNNDYLVKPSQNSGGDMPAISSKTFTMSFYFYKMPLEVASSARTIYTNVDDSGNFFSSRAIWNEISHGIYIGFYGASANSLYLQVPVEKLQPYTFYHVILSVNASTLTAQAYINDEDYSSYFYGIADVVYYLASTNNRNFYVGSASRDALHKGRLAHFYMDTNFVDLSVESNRRIFSDSNGKPGEVSALVGRNPFIYLPFNDPDAPGKNLGVYSDLQAYGSMGASQRGPNQWNCVASEFDGVGDYLSSTGIGAGSSNTVTFSFQVTPDLSSAGDVFGAYDGGSTIGMQLRLVQDGTVSISAQNTSGSYLLGSSNTGSFRFTSGKSHSVQFSVDLSDSTKTVLIVNGSAIPISFFQFLDDVFNLNDSFYVASAGFISNRLNAALGEFYFDTTYIDLATNNPFWDADAGKPKPVLQVLEETGNTPLIAMPIRADDAGRNYGTGGDFTVNPGPFIGARGASEFWARSADFDGSTGYM